MQFRWAALCLIRPNSSCIPPPPLPPHLVSVNNTKGHQYKCSSQQACGHERLGNTHCSSLSSVALSIWQHNISSTIEYPAWFPSIQLLQKNTVADFQAGFYNPFFSYCELFKMSKYANHSWPPLNHKMQHKIKLKFWLSLRKNEKILCLLKHFEYIPV